jgi:prepilin-type N-terminal cleavage/methylation domain-containing protein
MGRRRSRGFTLLELALVVAIIATITSIAAPTYLSYKHRSLAAEAIINVQTIAHLEQVTILETGGPIACAANPATVPSPIAVFADTDDWADLGFDPEGRVRYQYEVSVTGEDFVVRARGDHDADGRITEFSMDSKTMALARRTAGSE